MRPRGLPGTGAVDPSMGAMGAYVSYQPMQGFGLGVDAPPATVEQAMAPAPRSTLAARAYGVLSVLSTAALVFHGYRRNQSVGWAIGWGLLGGIAPIVAIPVALAQGFGKPRHGLTPNRSRRRRQKRQRKNASEDDADKRFVYFDADEVAAGVPDSSAWDWNHVDIWETIDSAPKMSSKIKALPPDGCLVLPDGGEIWRTR